MANGKQTNKQTKPDAWLVIKRQQSDKKKLRLVYKFVVAPKIIPLPYIKQVKYEEEI